MAKKYLPEWFALEKYRACDSFGAVEWYARLRERKQVADMLFDENYGAMLQEVVDPDGSPERFKAAMRELVSPMLVAMRSAPLGEVFSTSFSLSELGHSLPVRHADKIPPGEMLFFSPVMVDLRASDAALKDAFSVWLAKVRAAQPAAERPKAIYDRWARYGVLPYLDLSIWTWETGAHIPDRVMSAAISRYDMGEANLRKTVKPLALGLLADLSALEEVASIDAAKENPPSPSDLLFRDFPETSDG